MVLSENTYLTKDGLWSELDALGEDRVRHRLAEGAYRDRTRLLVEEWLRQQADKRSLEAERRALEAEKRSLEAERRALERDPYRIVPRVAPPDPREPLRIEHIERRDDKVTLVAATAGVIAALMATIAATASVLTYTWAP
jgi:hypothetical protein